MRAVFSRCGVGARILHITVALALLALTPSCDQSDSQAENARLKAQIERLTQENALLREERRATAPERRFAAESSNGLRTAPEVTLSHWITLSSAKRHNSRCRYYHNSRGRMCRPDEGVACRLCGG